MAAASWFKYTYLAHFSQPKPDRQLYRLVKSNKVCRIVELGIASLRRVESLVEVAQRFAGESRVHYTGLDWFDTRPTELTDLRLKHAHQRLQPTGAAVRLVPGPPAGSLPAVANAHLNTDLLIISHLVDERDLEPAWFYVPRMLHDASLILREHRREDGRSEFTPLSRSELADRAVRHAKRRAA